MKKMATAVVVSVFLCSPVSASVENTVWEYASDYPPIYYGFYGGNVYSIQDGTAYLYPQRLDCFAFYGNDFALAFNYSYGSFGYLFSDFVNKKAIQLGAMMFLIPYRIDYDLKKIGVFYGE